MDVILAIGSSGLIPAALIAAKLKVPEFYSIKVERYDEGKPPRVLYDDPVVHLYSNIDLTGKSVLVVDDLIRTGKTITKVLKIVENVSAKRIITLVLVLKKNAPLDRITIT